MRWKLLLLLLSLLGATSFTRPSFAAEPRHHDSRALAGELPAALQAIHVRPQDVLTRREATQVRGQWIMTVNLPYFATQIQSQQPFTLQLWTVGAGIAPGTPVYIRLSVH